MHTWISCKRRSESSLNSLAASTVLSSTWVDIAALCQRAAKELWHTETLLDDSWLMFGSPAPVPGLFTHSASSCSGFPWPQAKDGLKSLSRLPEIRSLDSSSARCRCSRSFLGHRATCYRFTETLSFFFAITVSMTGTFGDQGCGPKSKSTADE
jgi:hypothetical protein